MCARVRRRARRWGGRGRCGGTRRPGEFRPVPCDGGEVYDDGDDIMCGSTSRGGGGRRCPAAVGTGPSEVHRCLNRAATRLGIDRRKGLLSSSKTLPFFSYTTLW